LPRRAQANNTQRLGTQAMTSSGYLASKQAKIPASITLRDYGKINDGTTIENWLSNTKTNLTQTASKLEFKLKNTDADNELSFTPQHQRYLDRYGIYIKRQEARGTAVSTGGTSSVAVVACGGGSATGGTPSIGGNTSFGLFAALSLMLLRRNRRPA
jgi:hypothetical protein